jgi:hypothetical protein
MKKTGSRASVFFTSTSDGTPLLGGSAIATTAGKWYLVVKKLATGSGIPVAVGAVFQAPKAGTTQVSVAATEELLLLKDNQLCKTRADWSAEQGSVDVTDDCSGGYVQSIIDGYTSLSGSFGRFMVFDDVTKEFTDVTMEVLNKFFDVVKDDAAGVYTLTARDGTQVIVRLLMNNDAKAGEYQNWLIFPAVFTSAGGSLGLKDAQNQDIAWTMGEGKAEIYKRLIPSS